MIFPALLFSTYENSDNLMTLNTSILINLINLKTLLRELKELTHVTLADESWTLIFPFLHNTENTKVLILFDIHTFLIYDFICRAI